MSRVAELRSQILKAKQAYYYGGTSPISDAQYDSLEDELRALAPNDAIFSIVGAPIPPDAMLTKAPHRIKMGSQSKVNTIAEFEEWYEKSSAGGALHMSLKGDGASAAAYYEAGELIQVISRGDGSIGEDITANAFKFKGLPASVPDEFTGAIRMEVILTVEDWGVVDSVRSKNPRNAGTGIMGRKNGVQSELLTCFAFDIEEVRGGDSFPFLTEQQKCERLRELGCNVIQYEICKDAAEAIGFYRSIVKTRDSLPFWIDGVVIKVNDLSVQNELGITAGRPKGQIAWKFDSAGAESVLLSVSISGGHTGALIPNAQLKPVQIGGTTVSNASLANWDEVARLDLAVGDALWVIKANDIIPKVIRVTKRGQERTLIKPPRICPFCDGDVGRRITANGEEGVVLECQNEDCPKKSVGKIKRWITSVDIQGIGDAVRAALVLQLDLQDAADLYRLHLIPQALAELVINEEKDLRLGEKRTATILKGIEARRELGLAKFLGSLGIDRLGERRAELMIHSAGGKLSTLDSWREGTLSDSSFAESVGAPNTGSALQAGIDGVSELIEGLLAAGVVVIDAPPSGDASESDGAPSLCISGKLPSGKKKNDYKQTLKDAGYRLVDQVNADLSFLVLTDPDSRSAKAEKARKLNIAVISEEKMLELVKKP